MEEENKYPALRQAELGNDSSWADYWYAFNPHAISVAHPELDTPQEDLITMPGVDLDDPEIKELMSKANPEVQLEIANAYSNEHARRVYERNVLREEALNKIQGDPLVLQFIYGAVPALATESSLIPGGVLADTFKVAKTANTLVRMGKAAAAGAVTAGAAAAIDELEFGAQDVVNEPMSAFVYGAMFGGTIGALGGALSGPKAQRAAAIFHKDSDTFGDYMKDPDIKIDPETNKVTIDKSGVPEDAQVLRAKGANSIRRVNPLFGATKESSNPLKYFNQWVDSDVMKVYQGKAQVLRDEMTKLANATVALFDNEGKVVPIKWTAEDFKESRKGVWFETNRKLYNSYTVAKENGFKGSIDDFYKSVGDEYTKAIMAQERELNLAIKEKVNKFERENQELKLKDEETFNKKRLEEKKNAIEEFYASNNPEKYFEGRGKGIKEAMKHYRDFYKDHLDTSLKLGMTELNRIHENELYMPRLFDYDRVMQDKTWLEKLKRDVIVALKKHPANDDLTEEEFERIANEFVLTMGSIDYRQNFTHGSFIAPQAPGLGRLEARKFKLDMESLKDYYITDANELASRYQYQMSGRQAVQYGLGIDVGHKGKLSEYMEGIRQKLIDAGEYDEDLLKQYESVILDLSGQLRMNAKSNEPIWQFTRAATSYNTARFATSFSGNQVIEAVGSTILGGITNLTNGRFFKSVQGTAKLLYSGTKEADDFAQLLIKSGFLEDTLDITRINRFTDAENAFNTGSLEAKIQGFSDKMLKWTGLRYIKSVQEDFMGAQIITEIQKLGKKDKYTRAEATRLASMGLSADEARVLAENIDRYVDFREGRFELDKFSPDARDSLQLAISRGIRATVIQGDSIQLPTWFKVPSATKSLMLQFWRFPLIAHNILLRKGVSDEAARYGAAALSAIPTYMALKYLREQAAIATGLVDPLDAKYDYFDPVSGEDNIYRGMMQSLNYIGQLGMLTQVGNLGLQFAGLGQMGSDYSGQFRVGDFFGPTASTVQDIGQLVGEAFNDRLTTRQEQQKARSLLLPNIPILTDGLKGMIDKGL